MADALLVVGGLIALLVGAELVVRAGTGIARLRRRRAPARRDRLHRWTGAGTSSRHAGPGGGGSARTITTVLSTVRGQRDIAIGNLFGSSIYNIGAVLAVTILVAPDGLPVPEDVLAADLVLLGVVAAAPTWRGWSGAAPEHRGNVESRSRRTGSRLLYAIRDSNPEPAD